MLSAIAATIGCGTFGQRKSYTPEALRAEMLRRAPDVPPEDLVVPFVVPPELVLRARGVVKTLFDDRRAATALARALSAPDGFNLQYEWAVNNSAETTLRHGRGTCLGLSSVLVGLARQVGLDAYYVDASQFPERREERDVEVVAGHIGVGITTSRGILYVDFAGEMNRRSYFVRIDDLRAAAHFQNNLGYELIHLAQQAGAPVPWEKVRARFELATRIDPQFSRAWNNLGIALARLGRNELAARAYARALEIDPGLSPARDNLALLRARSSTPTERLGTLSTSD